MVSVCIASYNGKHFIYDQVVSILGQLSADDEIIISDDGSTDGTIDIIRSFNDSRIKLIHHKKDLKTKYSYDFTTRNLENALLNANGEYIFLADQDDIWKPDKVRKCLPLLAEHDLVLHDCDIINEGGEIIMPSYFDINKSRLGFFENLVTNSYLGCCIAVRSDVLLKALPFPKELVPHDIWIGLVAELYFKPYLFNEKLISYRRHSNNISPSGSKSPNSLSFKIAYRLQILKAVIVKWIRA